MKNKKVLIIGSIHYKDRMLKHKAMLESASEIEVKLPILDERAHCEYALDVILQNIELIKWADVIHMFWDSRSVGTIADWQTAVALGKEVVPMWIEEKYTYKNAIAEYFFKFKRPKSSCSDDWGMD